MVGLFHRVEMKCKQRSISDVGVHLLDRYCLMNHYRKLHLSTAHLFDNNFESFIIKKDRLQRLSGAHQVDPDGNHKIALLSNGQWLSSPWGGVFQIRWMWCDEYLIFDNYDRNGTFRGQTINRYIVKLYKHYLVNSINKQSNVNLLSRLLTLRETETMCITCDD